MKKGFGPNSFGWLRILIPFEYRFYNGSIPHDINYSNGGDEAFRRCADMLLLRDMELSCNNSFQLFFAYFYFMVVRIFGKYYFKYLTFNNK